MGRHQCSGDECGYCARRIDAAEMERDFPETDDYMADAAAADEFYGRGE